MLLKKIITGTLKACKNGSGAMYNYLQEIFCDNLDEIQKFCLSNTLINVMNYQIGFVRLMICLHANKLNLITLIYSQLVAVFRGHSRSHYGHNPIAVIGYLGHFGK